MNTQAPLQPITLGYFTTDEAARNTRIQRTMAWIVVALATAHAVHAFIFHAQVSFGTAYAPTYSFWTFLVIYYITPTLYIAAAISTYIFLRTERGQRALQVVTLTLLLLPILDTSINIVRKWPYATQYWAGDYYTPDGIYVFGQFGFLGDLAEMFLRMALPALLWMIIARPVYAQRHVIRQLRLWLIAILCVSIITFILLGNERWLRSLLDSLRYYRAGYWFYDDGISRNALFPVVFVLFPVAIGMFFRSAISRSVYIIMCLLLLPIPLVTFLAYEYSAVKSLMPYFSAHIPTNFPLLDLLGSFSAPLLVLMTHISAPLATILFLLRPDIARLFKRKA